MRQPPEFFGEQDLELLYIAKKLDDAIRLEAVLDEAGAGLSRGAGQVQGRPHFPVRANRSLFHTAPEQSGALERR